MMAITGTNIYLVLLLSFQISYLISGTMSYPKCIPYHLKNDLQNAYNQKIPIKIYFTEFYRYF